MNCIAKNKLILFVLVFLSTILFTSCSRDDSKKQYYDVAKQFNEIYFETVECIDLSDTMSSLEKLQSDSAINNIDQLGMLIEDIKMNVPRNKEKIYINFKQRYEDLVFIKESYSKFSNLSKEDRGRIDRIFISIGLNKANWKDKNSTVVWE